MIIRYGKDLMKKFGNIIYNYMLKKFKKIDRRYLIRSTDSKMTDLKGFCKECMDDEKLKIKAKELSKVYYMDDWDKLMIHILRYVHNILTYKSDLSQWGIREYWQTARVTFEKKTGDCEDGAILILTLARLAGVPENRIFLSCGYCKTRSGVGGHAYVTYRGNDGAEYVLDWCYYHDRNYIPNHKTFLEDKRYLKPRWFFGNEMGFYK